MAQGNSDIVQAAFDKAVELADRKAQLQDETTANRDFLRLLARQGLVDKGKVEEIYPTRERKSKKGEKATA